MQARDAVAAGSPGWMHELLGRVDAMDVEGFIAFLRPDARFRFANAPAATGREAIAVAVAGFFTAIRSLRHEITGAWTVPGHSICEGRVTYTRLDGSRLSVPFVNVLEMAGGLVADYRIYVDAAALFAPAPSSADGVGHRPPPER